MATSIEIIPANIPISVTQGNTLSWVTTITENGTPIDLTQTGTRVVFVVETTTTENNVFVLDSDLAEITLDAAGNAGVVMSAADTTEIGVGGYYYALRLERDGTGQETRITEDEENRTLETGELRVTEGNAANIRTLHAGTFTVLKPII